MFTFHFNIDLMNELIDCEMNNINKNKIIIFFSSNLNYNYLNIIIVNAFWC
jgi:hypothetical protein